MAAKKTKKLAAMLIRARPMKGLLLGKPGRPGAPKTKKLTPKEAKAILGKMDIKTLLGEVKRREKAPKKAP